MLLLDFLTQAFIKGFGITQPPPERQRVISLIVGGFMLGVFLLGLAVSGFIYYQLHAGR